MAENELLWQALKACTSVPPNRKVRTSPVANIKILRMLGGYYRGWSSNQRCYPSAIEVTPLLSAQPQVDVATSETRQNSLK